MSRQMMLACPVQFHNMDSDDGAELLNCRFVVPWGPGLFCFAAAMFSLAEVGFCFVAAVQQPKMVQLVSELKHSAVVP
ncbi:hypothetical protein Nepgr_015797 [Nepenthes gracilis]|uniref:Uncharacterized protein n=1 Tax=Nepenthes gracilis TaxID=150966 RepID=A0AAD3SP57_NEPGR|nr:hypothetical protein Nepgr_015797 [Nepenthes gracilis]